MRSWRSLLTIVTLVFIWNRRIGSFLLLWGSRSLASHRPFIQLSVVKQIRTSVNRVVGWGKVENLLLCDLSLSVSHLSRPLLKRRVSSMVSDQAICYLIFSFMDLPILDKTGNDLSKKEGIPVLSEFLDHLYFVDRTVETNYPYLSCARLNSELGIPGSIEGL